jgi:hypothetical protein
MRSSRGTLKIAQIESEGRRRGLLVLLSMDLSGGILVDRYDGGLYAIKSDGCVRETTFESIDLLVERCRCRERLGHEDTSYPGVRKLTCLKLT